MTYGEYYGDPFRHDIASILASHPQPHPDFDEDIAIQPRMLACYSSPIGSWRRDRLELFATALFFTVLVDEVAFTHYPEHYRAFRALTQYPKLLGPCMGSCRQHLNPYKVFSLVNRPSEGRYGDQGIECPVVFNAAIPIMEKEVLSFFAREMSGIDPRDFWGHCIPWFPPWAARFPDTVPSSPKSRAPSSQVPTQPKAHP